MSEANGAGYQITIDGLELFCVIGLNEWERLTRQKVEIDLVLNVNEPLSAIDDANVPKVDYRDLNLRLIELVSESAFRLVEALALAVCDLCLEYENVSAVNVSLRKPLALRSGKSVGIKMYKAKGG